MFFYKNLNTSYHEKTDTIKYVMMLYFLLTITLFIPESIYKYVGIDALGIFKAPSSVVQYYILSSSFPNATFVFFMIAPVVLVVNSILFIKRYNNIHSRSEENKHIFKKLRNKKQDRSLLIKALIILFSVISIIINPVAPKSWGGFILLESRFAMAFYFAGGFGLLIPVTFSLVIVKTREMFK